MSKYQGSCWTAGLIAVYYCVCRSVRPLEQTEVGAARSPATGGVARQDLDTVWRPFRGARAETVNPTGLMHVLLGVRLGQVAAFPTRFSYKAWDCSLLLHRSSSARLIGSSCPNG